MRYEVTIELNQYDAGNKHIGAVTIRQEHESGDNPRFMRDDIRSAIARTADQATERFPDGLGAK